MDNLMKPLESEPPEVRDRVVRLADEIIEMVSVESFQVAFSVLFSTLMRHVSSSEYCSGDNALAAKLCAMSFDSVARQCRSTN